MKKRRSSKRGTSRRLELLSGAAVLSISIVIILAYAAAGTQRYAMRSPSVAAVVSAVLVDLANSDRAASNLQPLTINPALVAAAQAKANDMAAKGYFAHTSPEGVDPWHWFAEAGYSFQHAGENLAVDFSDSGDVERAWMNSTAHRENILDSKFTEIGIATAEGMYKGHPTTFVVQEFGTPKQTLRVATGQAPKLPESVTESTMIETQTIPKDPTKPAVASARAERPKAPTPRPTVRSAATSTQTAPALAASLAQEAQGQKPLWAYPVSYPKTALKYFYGFLAVLVILALAYTTRFEMRLHHVRHATAAAVVIALMGSLLLAANVFVFAPPVILG